jgi:hypothetical protein
MNKKLKTIIIVAILLAALAITAYGLFYFAAFKLKSAITSPSHDSGLESLPCVPASQVELGYPYVDSNSSTAKFTTAGGMLYIASRYFDHTGLFASGKGSTAIYIGLTNNAPIWDSKRSIVTNTLQSFSLPENKYIKFSLPSGRYWLWSSRGGDIVIYSCEANGVSDPKPVK